MSTIIFTAGAKGGTGKSTAARFIITYLREKGFNPLLLDMDEESKTLSRFFPEAKQITIGNEFSHDLLINKAVKDGEKLIVADLKAGTGKDTLAWWATLPFAEIPTIKFICVASVTSAPDSVLSFLNWAGTLKRQVSYVVFKNQKDGDAFPDYDDSPQAIVFRSQYNPVEIDLPRLHERYTIELDRLNLTIDEVLEAGTNETINGKQVSETLSGILDRARLRAFRNHIYDQLNGEGAKKQKSILDLIDR